MKTSRGRRRACYCTCFIYFVSRHILFVFLSFLNATSLFKGRIRLAGKLDNFFIPRPTRQFSCIMSLICLIILLPTAYCVVYCAAIRDSLKPLYSIRFFYINVGKDYCFRIVNLSADLESINIGDIFYLFAWSV